MQHSTEQYGIELAQQVAKALLAGKKIMYTHRDYCGMGLIYENAKFQFVYVEDGYDTTPITGASFSDELQFIQFLAQQSDFTLSGEDPTSIFFEQNDWNKNNQRLNIARLHSIL